MMNSPPVSHQSSPAAGEVTPWPDLSSYTTSSGQPIRKSHTKLRPLPPGGLHYVWKQIYSYNVTKGGEMRRVRKRREVNGGEKREMTPRHKQGLKLNDALKLF